MASGKISPRQKMINMMYLVLTALLAMNVSSEILNAFKTVNRSLNKSISVLNEKNGNTYSALADAYNDAQTKQKAAIWKPVAEQIKAKSNALFADIEKYKEEIKKSAGKKDNKLNEAGDEVFKEDDLDVSTKKFVEGKEGKVLYDKMAQYKKDVMDIMKSTNVEPQMKEKIMAEIALIEKNLPVNLEFPKKDKYGKAYPPGHAGWSRANFYSTPAIAAITILTKLQNDVKSTEGQLSDYCLSQIGKVKLIYDKFAAVAAANTTYCMPGEEITVSAGVGAFNDQAKPQINIKGSNVPLGAEGMSEYKFKAAGPGEYTIPVSIQFTTPAGEVKTEKREIKYTVGQPSGAALMLDKMNVFYIGLDNPITVSSGTGDERTKLSASGGGITLTKSAPGKYIVRATTVGPASITIQDGKQNTEFKYRVKTVPNPIITIGGTIRGGKVPGGTMKAQQGLIPLLENFDFEAKFDVISYEWTYKPTNGDLIDGKGSGPRFTDQLNGIIKAAKPKDMIMIERVKVVGPDKQTRTIQGITVQFL